MFENNRLVLVGENGSGKTSILRMLYYFLSGQWPLLHDFRFEALEVTFDNQKHQSLERNQIELGLLSSDVLPTRHFSPGLRDRIRMALQEVRMGSASSQALEEIAGQFRGTDTSAP